MLPIRNVLLLPRQALGGTHRRSLEVQITFADPSTAIPHSTPYTRNTRCVRAYTHTRDTRAYTYAQTYTDDDSSGDGDGGGSGDDDDNDDNGGCRGGGDDARTHALVSIHAHTYVVTREHRTNTHNAMCTHGVALRLDLLCTYATGSLQI